MKDKAFNIVKKYAVIVVIAVLFVLFSFSVVELIKERPEYEDYCDRFETRPLSPDYLEVDCEDFGRPSEVESDDCHERGGYIAYSYDSNGCPASYECDMCAAVYEELQEDHRFMGFIVTSVLGLIAILVGLYAKTKNVVVQWVYSGIIIGGILSILFGTMTYFDDMSRFLKPFILLAEMVLIILVAIKTYKK